MEKNTKELLVEKRVKLQELREKRAALARRKANITSDVEQSFDQGFSSTRASIAPKSTPSNITTTTSSSSIVSTTLQNIVEKKSHEHYTSTSLPIHADSKQIEQGKTSHLIVTEVINLLDIAPASDSERIFFSKGVEANIQTTIQNDLNNHGTKTIIKEDESERINQLNQHARTDASKDDVTIEPVYLSENEIQEIEATEDYHTFLEKSTKYVERILHQKFDPLVDYTLSTIKRKDKEILSKENTFMNDFSKDRAVTSLDWSPLKSELFLASYSGKSKKDIKGGVLIWSIYLPERPEFHLLAPFPITKAVFHPYEANIVIGASKAGHVLLWNMSVSSFPIQQSPVDPEFHTYPICGLKVVGTSHAPTVISICTDNVCIWKMTLFTKPTKKFYLCDRESNPVSPTCFTISPHESSRLYAGEKSGLIYSTETYERNKEIKILSGHFGPVLGLDCHNSSAYKDLLLSCGVDWSVRLWNTKTGEMVAAFSEYGNFVYSVKWSPIHPAVFATVDGGGFLKIWNLDVEKSLPIYSKIIDDIERSQALDEQKRTLTDLCFSNDGSMIVVGSIYGHTHQLQLDETLWNIKPDQDFKSFAQWLSKSSNA